MANNKMNRVNGPSREERERMERAEQFKNSRGCYSSKEDCPFYNSAGLKDAYQDVEETKGFSLDDIEGPLGDLLKEQKAKAMYDVVSGSPVELMNLAYNSNFKKMQESENEQTVNLNGVINNEDHE